MRSSTAVVTRLAALLAVLLLAASPAGAQTPEPVASASGWASDFASFQALVGGVVHVAEDPELTATVAEDGSWRIDGLPVGSEATFVLEASGQVPIQTATFTVPADGLERVSFQSPSEPIAAALGQVIGEEIRDDRCQIASTVTRRGYSLDVPGPDGTHGEPGATVTIEPEPPAGGTAVYFNLSAATTIWPDRSLRSTTADGGVLFANVTPGTYVLRAHKAGAEIDPVRVRCTAGRLTNASPPHGLQVRAGGLDLDETVPFGPYDPEGPGAPTSTSTSTSVPAGPGPSEQGTGATAAPAIPLEGSTRLTG